MPVSEALDDIYKKVLEYRGLIDEASDKNPYVAATRRLTNENTKDMYQPLGMLY